MYQIHPQARTTPAVRAEIARSSEGTGVLARRYGISDETVRKWRRRGIDACTDRSGLRRSWHGRHRKRNGRLFATFAVRPILDLMI